MKKIVRTLMKTGLYILVFAIIFLTSACLSIVSIVKHGTECIETEWNDTIGMVIKDLKFDDREETGYDLYLPARQDYDRASLILFIHGGGFTGGDKSDQEKWCRYFTSKGYITASINYTVADGKHDADINLMNDEVMECVAAIRTYCEDMGIHISGMALSGQSAGGCLAMLYAYREADRSPIPVKFVFQQTGPADFSPESWGSTNAQEAADFTALMTGTKITAKMVENGEYLKYVEEISPAAHINGSTVPTICAYGPNDVVVPVSLKYKLFEKLDSYGVTYDYIEYPNSGHGLLNDPDRQEEYVNKALEYCDLYFDGDENEDL